jgi:CBS domain-containing protein
MKCHDVMKQDPVRANPTDSVQMAAESMRQFNVGFLPVVGPNEIPMGALTDRDIAMRVIAENKLSTTTVLDVMTRDCVTVREGSELSVAEDLMVTHQIARVMVVDDDDGHLKGVISLSDIPANESGRVFGAVFARVAEREARPEL